MLDYKNTPDGKATARKYADIIHLSRPASRRVKMDHVQRAKIFAPFDALRGFDAEIDIAQDYGREISRIELSDEQREKLSDRLREIRKGERITARYFVPGLDENTGNYIAVSGTVTRIDPIEKVIEVLEQEHEPEAAGGRLEKTLPTVIGFDDLLDIDICTNRVSTNRDIFKG